MAVGQLNPALALFTNHEYPTPPLTIWLLVQLVPQRVPVPLVFDDVYVMWSP
jgi:hypothetical protein